ncbi:Inner membrane protein translocase component YidC, short form OxaI-like [Pediococcus damnosus]|uniref:membrane protein insertase YidC n=1 Tax=Pediococcus damnosus TaxID=51663 RepID=UPI00078B7194|nr:membrane protein insertase YidC [Pediococcus damnosus]AMV69303.1 Inner membrane protein translocase component YidC, short form OxaI-like [Pediococcus damnosus]
MKHSKRNMVMMAVASLTVLLAGCSTAPITKNSTGFWDHWIVYNFSRAIIWLSKLFGNNYGWGIIVFTIIVRIIILPLMIYQTKSSMKTAEIQPKVQALQKKYSSKDIETQQKLRDEQQKLYAEAGVNPVAGCLPLIVQLPILYALYAAVSRTEVLKAGTFLWLQLGDRDPYFILPVIAAVFTYISSCLSMKSQPTQNGMTTMMTIGMPVIIFFTALSVPSAVSLYWVVTNIFQAGQTLLLQNPFKINREREAKAKAEQDKKRAIAKAKRKAYKGRNRK